MDAESLFFVVLRIIATFFLIMPDEAAAFVSVFDIKCLLNFIKDDYR